jgi:hypothetical protein
MTGHVDYGLPRQSLSLTVDRSFTAREASLPIADRSADARVSRDETLNGRVDLTRPRSNF